MCNPVNEELGLSHRKNSATLGDKAWKQTGKLGRSGSRDGMDANRVRQIGLINSLPRMGAALPYHPSNLAALVQTGSGSRDGRPAPQGH